MKPLLSGFFDARKIWQLNLKFGSRAKKYYAVDDRDDDLLEKQ